MASKFPSTSAPSTPPPTELPPRSQTPGGRTLPPSPPFTPTHDQEGQQQHLESTTANVDRILHFLTRHSSEEHQGIFNTCAAFDLPQSQLVQLERCLHAEGWEEKVRYDYDGTIGEAQLCLRMPSAIHEHFTQAVADEIQKELARLADRFSPYDQRAALETGKVLKSGSTTLEFEEPALVDRQEKDDTGPRIVRHSPDASFTHESSGAQAPGLVIEVGYSQQSNKLTRLADSYITNSRHKIRCVIALDILYHSPKQIGSGRDRTARLSSWRPGVEQHEEGDIGICVPTMEAVSFRDGKGLPCEGSLNLNIADFLRPSLCKKFSAEANQETIRISFTTLARLLDKAETCSESRTESEDDAPKVFRKRKRSPSEQLSSPREKAFANLELEDSAKEHDIDVDWPGSSKRRSLLGGHLPKLRRSSRHRNSDKSGENLT